MDQKETKKQASTPIVSAVLDDGTLVETVHDPVADETALLICHGERIERVLDWEHTGVSLRPVRASNNLIRHRAIRFASEAAEYGSAEALLADIDRYITRYVFLAEPARHLAIGYVLLTWLYDAFSELPYLRFRGEYGTGKTRALLVVGSITYKPFFASGASTVSPIFHTLDTFRGTLIFDEADFRFSDEKAELVKILNNGNANGFPVLRTRVTERREFDPQAFVVYGPKIVGMRHTYQDRALESRFLSIDMLPGNATGVPINLPAEHEVEALALRNKLLRYRIDHRQSARLDTGLADRNLEPRTNQILLPLLSVIPDEVMRRSIRTLAAAREGHIRSERGFTVEAQILSLLQPATLDRLPLKAIVAAFAEAYGTEYERPMSARYIGAVLRRLGLVLYKSDGVYVLAPSQQQTVAALQARYGAGGDSTGTTATTDQPGTSGT